MKKTVLVFISFLLVLITYADRGKSLDSLSKLLVTAKEDTGKAMLYIRIAEYYETNNQDSSNSYLQKGKALSELLNFDRGIYYYYQQSIILLYTVGDYDKAMKESVLGLALARKLKDSSKVLTMLNNIGIVHAYLGNLNGQLDYALQVKNTVEAIKDSSKLTGAYHNLANCYHNLEQYRKSLEAASYSIYINNIYSKKSSYINRVYATLAQDYDALRMVDSALFFYKIAIKESIQLNDKFAEGMIYGYQCDLYAQMNLYDVMLDAAKRSLSVSNELQSSQMLASSLYNTAYAYFLNNNLPEAKKNINQALVIALRDSLRDELRETYNILSYIAARDGDYKTTVWAKRQTDSIEKIFLNEQVIKSTTEMEKKYETENKDNQIKLQKADIQKKKTFNYLLIGGTATLLLISLLSYRNYRHKQELQQQRIDELETEKQLTATEAVLKGEEQERTRLAKDLHDGLGGMLSGIKYSFNTVKGNLIMTPENSLVFERCMDMLDGSIMEMRRVAHNMMPEALLNFGLDAALKDLCNDINQSGMIKVTYQTLGLENTDIDQTIAITIYRIVQELLNNTMKHAAAINAIVQINKTGEQIAVTVEDDGKGFDPVILNHARGIGWTNIQSRVYFLKGKLDLKSQPGKGTSVLIELKT